MKFPSEPNETERAGLVRAALHEAAHYEADTAAPDNLVAQALARHERSGRRCGEARPVPAFALAACGLVLATGATLRLQWPQPVPSKGPSPGSIAALAPDTTTLPHLDLAHLTLSPIDSEGLAALTRQVRSGHRFARHAARRRQRSSHPLPLPASAQVAAAPGMWRTETVHCEVVTQTVTPVWIARPDPETATIVLTPALFQLAVQPDDADTDASEVAATVIPVHFEDEQENQQP